MMFEWEKERASERISEVDNRCGLLDDLLSVEDRSDLLGVRLGLEASS